MAAGIWNNQNKKRPGVYINFKQSTINTQLGERGVVTLPLELNWGPEHQVIEVTKGTNTQAIFGDLLEDIVPIRETLKRASKVLVYRLNANTGVKATATEEALKITACYSGTLGNELKIVVSANGEAFDVKTFRGTTLLDIQEKVKNIEDLENNQWVIFSGKGALKAVASIALQGGTSQTVTANDYSSYRNAVEVYKWNVCALYNVSDVTTKAAFKEWIKRLRDSEGNKVQMVAGDYYTADYEGVISVKNGVILEDGTNLNNNKCVAWVAGASAAADSNESLTFDCYDGAIDVDKKYTNSDIEEAITNGELVFTASNNKAKIEYDINTLHTYSKDRGKIFSKNRTVRVLDCINNDLVDMAKASFIGKIDNNADGRNILKNEIAKYLKALQNKNAIQNLDTQQDIEILQGEDKDAVLVNLSVQPVDSIEKIYMTVEVK